MIARFITELHPNIWLGVWRFLFLFLVGGDVFEIYPHFLVWAGLKLLILLCQLFLLVGIQRVYYHSHIRNSTCGMTAEGRITGGKKESILGETETSKSKYNHTCTPYFCLYMNIYVIIKYIALYFGSF